MKLIAHRGLTQGPDLLLENHPDHIQETLNMGFDCEVDVWRINNELFLGHDQPQYPISESFLAHPQVWLHAKNVDALCYLSHHTTQYHFFWHEREAFVCTNRGFLWTYPGQILTPRSICVVPELYMPLQTTPKLVCYAICSDYVHEIREIFRQ
jgi:hypothetical protein